MNQRPSSRLANKLFSVILLLSLLLSNFGGKAVPSVQAQKTADDNFVSLSMVSGNDNDFVINTGNYQIPKSLLTSLIATLGQLGEKAGGATSFGVGYYEEHRSWAWINLLVANGSYFDKEEIGPTFLFFGIKKSNTWNVVLAEDDQEYIPLLDKISRDTLNSEEVKLLDQYYGFNQTNSRINALAEGLLFPWSNSQNPWGFSGSMSSVV